MFFYKGLGTRSHTSFHWNWFSSSCITNIHPSSKSASSTVVRSITDNSPIIDSSGPKYDLVLLGLSLFPIIWSLGCEDLYLKVFLDWSACWEPSCATSKATSSCASGVGSASGLTSDALIWSGSGVSSESVISAKLSSCLIGPQVYRNIGFRIKGLSNPQRPMSSTVINCYVVYLRRF